MRRAKAIVLTAVLCCSSFARAYQYRTHHGITGVARRYLVTHEQDFGFDNDFVRLIKDTDERGPGFGDLIDSRAGDPYEDAWLDEDHEEGRLDPTVAGCPYVEGGHGGR